MKLSCSQSKEYVYLTDGFERFIFCGETNYPRFVMTSRSNWIQMHFVSNSTFVVTFLYKGFQFYVECNDYSFSCLFLFHLDQ
jgi:hypothetical protein